MDKTLKQLIYFLAFVEGGGVMCVELCSAKILSPYFGTSIYVWASVLGITLTALMSGYYLGGYISSRNQKRETVFRLMLVGGCLVTVIPLVSNFILPITINFSLLKGTVISLMCFLFFPLMIFGAVSPLIINLLTDEAKDSGKSSGTVYAVSTLGGIITTFMVGFYTLPEYGLNATLFSYGLIVIITSLSLFVITKKIDATAILLIVVSLCSYAFNKGFKNEGVIYKSEGILGEIKIVDKTLFSTDEQRQKPYRQLMVNNISQTIMDIQNPDKSYWDYVKMITYNINAYSKGKKALLLGMGGGTILRQLKRNLFEVDVVEIDERMEFVAKEYFGIADDNNIVIDDARHYIKTTDKKYDVIIYDLYHSETPPIHLMTGEAFSEISSRLNENGILAINFYGFIKDSKGKGARSIYKTLQNENFNVELMATPGEEQYRNLLYICSQDTLTTNNNVIDVVIKEDEINFEDAVILTDDKPELEHMYLEAALSWRKNYNEVNAKSFLKRE